MDDPHLETRGRRDAGIVGRSDTRIRRPHVVTKGFGDDHADNRTVRRLILDGHGEVHPAFAGNLLGDEFPAQPGFQILGDQARLRIRSTPGLEGDHELDRPRRGPFRGLGHHGKHNTRDRTGQRFRKRFHVGFLLMCFCFESTEKS